MGEYRPGPPAQLCRYIDVCELPWGWIVHISGGDALSASGRVAVCQEIIFPTSLA